MQLLPTKFRLFSGSSLKLLAILTMAIDHLAGSILYHGILLPQAPIARDTPAWTWYCIYKVMRFIGRIAFPIFCFFLVEGFLHTSNRKKYALRLFLFALISEIPFDLALSNTFMDSKHQNVFFTLFIGFLVIWIMDSVKEYSYGIYLQMITAGLGGLLVWLMDTDYDYKGIIVIVILYFFRYEPLLRTVAGCVSLLWEPAACLAFIPLSLYNGKRGQSLKYFFYVFYPAHLLFYGLILHYLF
ncbi:MAG: conjugal transfer protein TraX [Clostridia bacterium]|nr:conjugal transfer protein TraX [Clostridia bacterium]NCC43714.1 conjugal transfer protein TraX [Clostridia bacterium]